MKIKLKKEESLYDMLRKLDLENCTEITRVLPDWDTGEIVIEFSIGY